VTTGNRWATAVCLHTRLLLRGPLPVARNSGPSHLAKLENNLAGELDVPVAQRLRISSAARATLEGASKEVGLK
jgi:hypothetical protein